MGNTIGEQLWHERKPYTQGFICQGLFVVLVLNIHRRKYFVCYIFTAAQAYKIFQQ